MGAQELNTKVKELKELRRMSEELANAIEGITDAIKAEMTAQGVDTLTGIDWKITWKNITSNGFRKDADAGIHCRHLHGGAFCYCFAGGRAAHVKAVGAACRAVLGLVTGFEQAAEYSHM